MLETFLRVFTLVDGAFSKIIEWFLAAVLLGMVGLVFVQVVLRNLFDTGISWADVVGRHMVLWIAFLGAVLATRSRQHLSIDLVSRIVPRHARDVLRFILDIVACAVCAFLAAAAVTLVVEEHAMGSELVYDIPLWSVQLIIPVGFTLMAIEYALGVLLDVLRYFYDGAISKLASERRPA